MSKYSSYLVVFLFSLSFFFTSTILKAQLLWEISGNKLAQKSYLFGTVHVGDEQVIDYASNIYPYMDNSLTVAGELDLNIMTSFLAIGYIMSPSDSTLSKLLTKEEYQEIKPYLTKNIGQLAPFLDMVRPIFILAMLQEKEQKKLTESLNNEENTTTKYPALDMYLQNRARKNNQKVIGLETVKEQMAALSSSPISQQARELYDYIIEKNKKPQTVQDSVKVEVNVATIKENDTTLVELKKSESPIHTLISIYLSEDIELLHDQISNEFKKESYESLIVRRNIVMVKRMEEQMNKKLTKENKKSKKNIIFAAVGAGHLGGKKGMVSLLKEAGYTLTPIFFNKKEKEQEIKK